MTVTSNTTRNDYVAGTNQNVYNYTFQLNEASDVTVYLGGVVQTLNTHYTVQNVGVGTGGTITFTLVDGNNNPIFPTSGTAISIVMAMDLDRDTDYQANGAFLAAEVNNDYDRLWLASNQQQTALNRSLRLQDDDVAGASPSMELPLKDDRKGKLLGFHATTGEPITAVTINAADYVEKAGDTMTGTLNMGANKVTSSATPSATSDLTNKQYVDAAVAGVPQGGITGVTAGTGMTGGGTTGDVTLNVIGGTGITANADDISVDNTVVLTTGVQTLSNKSFSSIKLIENGDTKVQWPFGLNDDFFFADNQKVLFGIDMQLYHDGSNSYIKDVGTGNLYIDTNSSTHLSQGGNDKIVITSNQVTVDPRLQFNTLRGAGAIEVDIIRDEDDMVSDDPDALATQQSIKAYVDSQVSGDITAVTAGAGLTGGGTSGNVTLNAVGGTGITVNADDIQVTDNGIGALQLNVSGNGTSGQFLASDGDGTFSWQTGGSGGGGGSNLNIDTMTGDGSDTTLTLSINPTVENNTQVYIDGVYQNKDTYSVSGTTLTFSTAPPTGSAVEVMTITPTALLVPADGSVTPAKIASGDFYFDTNTLYVDSTNNRVGIGTTSPSAPLHVQKGSAGSSAFPSGDWAAKIFNQTDASTEHGLVVANRWQSDASTAFEVGGLLDDGNGFDTWMKVAGDGKVGIGTASPATALDTNGIVRASSAYSLSYAGVDGSTSAFGAGTISADANWGMFFKSTTGASVAEFAWVNAAGSERMRIDPAGNVGIGTSSPSETLHMFKATYPIFKIESTSYNGTLGIDTGSGNLVLNNVSNAGLMFNTNNIGRMFIDSSGHVGIGTTTPEYNLDVTADDNVTTTTALSVQNASRNYGLGLGAYTLTNRNIGGSAATVDYTFDIGRHAIFKTNNTERMRILSSGTLLVGKSNSATNLTGLEAHGSGSVFSSISSGNTYHVKNTTNNVFTFYVGYTGGVINYQALNVNLSDEREKKNIEPLESKWDSVKSWSLKTFHYNHQADESTKNYGVIAQDVEQTNPEAIDAYQKDENTERKGVKEQQMMWMAIKALQEAQTRIETLETRIAALEE